ncbi:MAG: hypothetical protein L0228_05900 [Planctomycetes bacterium]|nr:hypothetical protein [Planctomycetota bacterium]
MIAATVPAGPLAKDDPRMPSPDNETIYDRYFRLLVEWKGDSDLDKYHDHLAMLVAADHLASQMKADTDRIILALGSRPKA